LNATTEPFCADVPLRNYSLTHSSPVNYRYVYS